MVYCNNGQRLHERSYLEPDDTDSFLKVTFNKREHAFTLLDTSPGGIGVLVRARNKDVLENMDVGSIIQAEFGTPETVVSTRFRIAHATRILMGKFKGDYQIGLMHVAE